MGKDKLIRCRLSDIGRQTMIQSRRKMCEGEIVGETRDGQCYKVRWPGSKTASIYHKSFVEIISPIELQNPERKLIL